MRVKINPSILTKSFDLVRVENAKPVAEFSLNAIGLAQAKKLCARMGFHIETPDIEVYKMMQESTIYEINSMMHGIALISRVLSKRG